MKERKGIVLAGGSGTRLYPLTFSVSKQLLPVYDKPMIYYSISVLMLAGIKDILVITTPRDIDQYKHLLCDGSQWGINLSYEIQEKPDGIAQAYLLAEKHLNGAPSAMILGDNIFYGHNLQQILRDASSNDTGACIFGYHVNDPERYGVLEFDDAGTVKSIYEKPKYPVSNYAITGLYFCDENAPDFAKQVQASSRGELEITSLLDFYLRDSLLEAKLLHRGHAWFDTGTHESLLDASNFVRNLTKRQGLQIGSPDELAYNVGLISETQLLKNATIYKKTSYGDYLFSLIQTAR